MFLTVYLSNSEKHFAEVPVTPETLCQDVVDVCKEPGETDCYLAESWRGSGEDVATSFRFIVDLSTAALLNVESVPGFTPQNNALSKKQKRHTEVKK